MKAGHPICLFSGHGSVLGWETSDRLMDILKKFAVPVNNLVAFRSLRASAVLREKNPILSKFRAMNPNIVNADCFCHLAYFHSKSSRTALPALIKGQICDIYCLLAAISQGQKLIKRMLVFAEISILKKIM